MWLVYKLLYFAPINLQSFQNLWKALQIEMVEKKLFPNLS